VLGPRARLGPKRKVQLWIATKALPTSTSDAAFAPPAPAYLAGARHDRDPPSGIHR